MTKLAKRGAGPVGLLKVEEAQRILAQAKSIDEVKAIRDASEAVRLYLRKQKAGHQAQNDAAEIKLRAERRLGEPLQEQKVRGERDRGGRRKESHAATHSPPPTLRDLEITKSQSSRWQDVANVPEKKFETFLATKRADARGEITVAGLRREEVGEVRRQERFAKLGEIARGNIPRRRGDLAEHYPVIYADPPWRYEHVETENRAIENHYPTMDLDAICALEVEGRHVRERATPDAALFLWATPPKLAEAMRVVEAWGFAYRTCAVWVKDKIGMGYYYRQRHELLLVATRGAMPTPAPDVRPDSVIGAPRGAHSAKPALAIEQIERMYPGLPRVELFLRGEPRPGWDGWGNQAA